MKRFLKRMNRGLVLAAVLLAGLIVYIMIDSAAFKSSVPEIQEQVETYLEAVKTVNLEEPSRKTDDAKMLLEQYWCGVESMMTDMGSAMTKSGGLDYLNMLEEQGGDYTRLTGYKDMIGEVKVSKNGPGCAKATVNYSVSVESQQKLPEEGYRILGLQGDSYYYYGGGMTGNEDGTQMDAQYILTFLFYEKDGGWKIGSVDYESSGDGY